jgi:hypothetical protein
MNSWDYYDASSGIVPWIEYGANSGSCSVINMGSARYATPDQELYNILGNINTSLIKNTKTFDQESVLTNRSGDGTFLDFSQDGLAAALTFTNQVLSTASYFNPVLGFPLTCGGIGLCDGSDSDNGLITIPGLVTIPALKPIPSILNFPFNNATITNGGVSDLTIEPNAHPTTYMYYTNRVYIDKAYIDAYLAYQADQLTANPTLPIPPKPVTDQINQVPIGINGYLARAYYSQPQQDKKFYTGGSSTTNAGRYSLKIQGGSDQDERANSYENSGRCAVMINN